MPIPEITKQDPKTEPNSAVALLDTLSKEQSGQSRQEAAKDDSQWMYFQQCRRGHIAFFYVKNPGNGIVDPSGWYSRDKRADEPWRGIVPCQECSTRDADGYLVTEEPTQVNYQPSVKRQTRFIADPRFLYRMGKTEELRKKTRPHRAQILNITAANVGVPNPDFPDSVRTIRRRQMVETEVRS